jgi:hypothetical protein
MPSIKTRKKPQGKHGKLVTALAGRFTKPPESADLPLVVVNQLSRASGKHIVVIWDDWQDLAGAERGRIITDAYLAAHPDASTPVTIPIGVTAAEALAMGYLKYEIQPHPQRRSRDHQADRRRDENRRRSPHAGRNQRAAALRNPVASRNSLPRPKRHTSGPRLDACP